MRLPSNDNLRVRRIDVEPSARPFESRSTRVSSSPLQQGEAMITKHSPPAKPIRWNGHRRVAPRESLSARIFRLRIARGDSIYDLARETNVLAGTIRKLESGKPADKRVLPALAAALGVPLCQLYAATTTAPHEPACERRRHRSRSSACDASEAAARHNARRNEIATAPYARRRTLIRTFGSSGSGFFHQDAIAAPKSQRDSKCHSRHRRPAMHAQVGVVTRVK